MPDCSTLATTFAVNPVVTVKITRTGLPTLFSRVWGNTGNNLDPRNPDGCTNNWTTFVNTTSGAIQHSGISLGGGGANGIIGETFWLVPDCHHSTPGSCQLHAPTPQGNYPAS